MNKLNEGKGRPNYGQLIADVRFYRVWGEERFVRYVEESGGFERSGDFMEYLYWVETVAKNQNPPEINPNEWVDEIVLRAKGPTDFWMARKAAKLVMKLVLRI